jgi:hypothetical protein
MVAICERLHHRRNPEDFVGHHRCETPRLHVLNPYLGGYVIRIEDLPQMQVPELLRTARTRLDAAAGTSAGSAVIRAARFSVDNILAALLSGGAKEHGDAERRLRDTARNLIPVTGIDAQSAMLAILAAADMLRDT